VVLPTQELQMKTDPEDKPESARGAPGEDEWENENQESEQFRNASRHEKRLR
jgi:hypothetical protein